MASDGQIVFEVTADGTHAIADVRDITSAIQRETRNWDNAARQSTNNIGNGFSSMLKKIAAGFSIAGIGKALISFGKDAVQAASDLQEVQNVVDTTFGANSNKIDNWAKQAATQFGLTETQAKRFTSTLGAMMKSSGLAGSEIVDMSTDLAGLAADMASFYNLDFDTAFQKIRSGISGETEPLKQLGINMSVANLNAFALQKGLTKTFNEMTQGEQTMLRYQYLMQATADAQGDFAKTSDSYANSVRTLETSLTDLKTKLGNVLLDVVTPLVNGINELFPDEKTDKYSLLDRVAEIEINKDAKLAEIEEIATSANALIEILDELSTTTVSTTALTDVANSANILNSDSAANWSSLLTAFTNTTGLETLFGTGSEVSDNISELAEALAGNSLTTTKAEAWETLMSALADNAEGVAALTGESVSDTEAWLKGLAGAAKELDPNDAAAWNTLISALISGVGLNTEAGQEFVSELTQQFLAMGTGSEDAINGLKALGYTSDEIEQKQTTWLKTCKELVKTMPGLSDIIDTNTGEIKGGIDAVRQYADEWERTAKYEAEVAALKAERDLVESISSESDLWATATTKKGYALAAMKYSGIDETEAKAQLDLIDRIAKAAVEAGVSWEDLQEHVLDTSTVFDSGVMQVAGWLIGLPGMLTDGVKEAVDDSNILGLLEGVEQEEVYFINNLTGRAKDKTLEYAESLYEMYRTQKELPDVLNAYDEALIAVADEYGVTTDALEDEIDALNEAAESMSVLEKAAQGDADALETVTTAVETAHDALVALADYYEEFRNTISNSVNDVVKGFDKIDYTSGATYKKISDLTAKLTTLEVGSDEYKSVQAQIDAYNETLAYRDSMYSALESQAEYMDSYMSMLKQAQEMGLSNELLASLADGSVESYQYLNALLNDSSATHTAAEIDAK